MSEEIRHALNVYDLAYDMVTHGVDREYHMRTSILDCVPVEVRGVSIENNLEGCERVAEVLEQSRAELPDQVSQEFFGDLIKSLRECKL